MTFPNETLPKGRMQKTTGLYDRLVAKGARMGQSFGLEHAGLRMVQKTHTKIPPLNEIAATSMWLGENGTGSSRRYRNSNQT